MKKFYFSNLLLAIIDSVYEVSTYRKPGLLESFKGFSLIRITIHVRCAKLVLYSIDLHILNLI